MVSDTLEDETHIKRMNEMRIKNQKTLDDIALVNARLDSIGERIEAIENQRAGKGRYSNKFLAFLDGAEIDRASDHPPPLRVRVKDGTVYEDVFES